MSKIGVRLKINCSQIDKARLFAGKKGSYLDATVFIDTAELDQYDNSGMITQDVSKDEKDQGIKGNILGNCQVFWVENGQAPQKAGQAPQQSYQQPPQVAPMQQAPSLAQQAAQHPQAQQQPMQKQQPPQGFAPQSEFDNSDFPF